ncbi:MAG TPA: diaminopimelate decarboxylase [Candidatus Acidoferrales bacterium]|nr:diaminopimelate decarboxylase [Candidatus Acidoferrales bacterium]
MTPATASTRKRKIQRRTDPTDYTPFFAYQRAASRQSQILHCEGVALTRLADTVGTPTYVYSRASIEAAYRRLDRAFGSLPHRLCYAVKANSNLSVLRVLANLGSCFDIVSGGELDRLRRIGVQGTRIVFSGVGKTRDEIREALRYRASRAEKGGILLFNIESAAELDLLLSESARHSSGASTRPFAAIRVNPDVMAGGHPHIATGSHHHKFGIDWPEARRLYLAHKDSRWLAWRGISAHLGSQIFSISPYRRALARLASYVRDLASQGVRLAYLDIGGGLGIRYTDESPLAPEKYAKALSTTVRPLGCTLLVEPGRTLVGPSGVLLTRVLYVKQNRGKTFVVVDAAMNDLIRPALYGAAHPITPVIRSSSAAAREIPVDVVGPVCESGDFFLRDWPLAPVQPGDLLVIWAAGAYSFAQSSNYNARRRAAEILVEGRRFRVARKRETYADLVRGEPV